VTTRADMGRHLSLTPGSLTKTFVVEVHTQEPSDYLDDVVGASNVEHTEDAYLFRVHAPDGAFWVDQVDTRFWTFHTDMPMREAFAFLRDRVEVRRDLDWMWLPSEHLRHVWPGAVSQRVRTDFEGHGFLGDSAAARDLKVQLIGRDAEALLDLIAKDARYQPAVSFHSVQAHIQDPELGWVNEGVNRMGRFAVSGDSLELHLQFVRAVVQRYRYLVELCEQKAVAWRPFEGDNDGGRGGTVQGGPINIAFSRPIEDLLRFLDELFAVRRPFRLWGVPEIVGGVAEVEAVDLHVGQRLRMDVGASWMRVYLEEGGCGNTVARLISNLQHHFDGALRLVDTDLHAAMTARSPTLRPISY
jgi:hypothetical protein